MQLQSALKNIVGGFHAGLIFDLSETLYIDSAGIQVILTAYRHIHPLGGRIALVLTNDLVREIFNLLQLNSFPGIFICDDIDSAKRLFTVDESENL